MLAAGLAGCGQFGGSSAPSVNGDTPIATVLDAPKGSPSDFDVNVGRRVFFAANSAELGDTDRATLDKQAAWLKHYTPYRMVVEGYADEPGSAAANLELGKRRAGAVVAYLVHRGVAASRLRAVSYGDTRPVRRCADASCWSQNRRAVTVLDAVAS
ncbi:peptidoglycan-associated lipoprotein [Lichenibacterium minor]|uniref:Peptidoglycan-associated lipoprotein n=1 Tax=Lichenibacterium minor TaxID=2316528 RepID=A0A4Q2U9C5_9HYPH|nr:peptidoglycan-associated lipoprotein [Lichenibacterium minor]